MEKFSSSFFFLFLFCMYSTSEGYELYREKIPNGHRIPHPCLPNSIWKGVGHESPSGGGARNPFGRDFAANGYEWTMSLCELDSDDDGQTNGYELGDPDCTWEEGDDFPDRIEDLTHPGVCEPLDAVHCMDINTFDVCKEIDFVCNATSDPDTYYLDLRLTNYTIPSKQTSHACIVLPLDETKDMHAIAMEPIIVQSEIVHHIDMIECKDGDPGGGAFPETAECGAMKGCSGIMLATWTLGMTGVCLLPQVGIRLGKHGAKGVMLSVHYHNPFNYEDRVDSSGLRMYVTENIRQYDAQVLNMAQLYLEIPPGETRVEQYIDCSPLCTDQLEEPIYLVFGGLHMHYLGSGGRTELWRDGSMVKVIMDEDYFDYNSPHVETFDPPIEVLPGDSIIHTCVFQSRDQTSVTWRGREATDEMCESVVVYYPAQNLSDCKSYGKVQRCAFRNDQPSQKYWGDCDINNFESNHRQDLIDLLRTVCDETGSMCMIACKPVVEQAHSNYTCLGPDYYEATLERSSTLRDLMRSCAYYVPMEEADDDMTTRATDDEDDGGGGGDGGDGATTRATDEEDDGGGGGDGGDGADNSLPSFLLIISTLVISYFGWN